MISFPRSYYDALSLCARLEPTLGPVARAELHLLAYLASLLAMYSGRPSTDWGYGFAITPHGYPFSPDLDQALALLVENGRLLKDQEGYVALSRLGRMELKRLQALTAIRDNEAFVDGACGAVLVMPIGLIREALGQEGDLRRVRQLTQSDLLPTDIGSELRREEFKALRKALPSDPGDLMIPAVVWLSYLSEVAPRARQGVVL